MKITSEACKLLITEWCRNNSDYISNQFIPPENPSESFLEKNWKRIYKTKIKEGIERGFDCKPYNDQLRAIIITNSKDENVISLVIQGE